MLLLLFYGTAAPPTPSTGGVAGRFSNRKFRVQQQMPNDDDQALKLLLDGEFEDTLDALARYERILRRLL